MEEKKEATLKNKVGLFYCFNLRFTQAIKLVACKFKINNYFCGIITL